MRLPAARLGGPLALGSRLGARTGGGPSLPGPPAQLFLGRGDYSHPSLPLLGVGVWARVWRRTSRAASPRGRLLLLVLGSRL